MMDTGKYDATIALGMVIRGSSTEEVKDGDYKLTKPDNKDIRATLDAHPAEDYMAGGTK